MTRSIDKGDALVLVDDLVRGDVLGYASGFAGDDIGLANEIEKCRLTVIDVPHDHHNGRTLYSL